MSGVTDGLAVPAQLGEADQQRLRALTERAAAQQAAALDAAIEGGLDHLPRPLRMVVRRVLFR